MQYVYVLNKHGEPLMPCSPCKARKLLKADKAKVAKRTPFTIRLLYGSSGYRQPVTLGVDAGSKHVGVSASTETKELFVAELRPRNDVVDLLSTRREFRRARRNRKTRHRAPRFNNRVHSKHKGWLAPSVEVKIQEHVSTIKRICGILPITQVIVETAEFDTQRLKAMLQGEPLPEGIMYQHGEMYDEYNVRQYILKRDDYRCRCCGTASTEKKPVKFHVHHLETRKTGGDSPGNFITLCEHCHKAYHDGQIVLKLKRAPSMRDAAFMGIMRDTLMQRLRNELSIPVKQTIGAVTKLVREENGIAKTHTSDALCIAKHPTASRCDTCYLIKPVRHHNRQIHKATILPGGVRKLNQAPKYVFGFQLFDKVKMPAGKEGFIFGRRSSGWFDVRTLTGETLSAGIACKKLQLLEKRTSYLLEREAVLLS